VPVGEQRSWKIKVLSWNKSYLLEKGIFIFQIKHILHLLKETGKVICKAIGTPPKQNHRIGSDQDSFVVNKGQY